MAAAAEAREEAMALAAALAVATAKADALERATAGGGEGGGSGAAGPSKASEVAVPDHGTRQPCGLTRAHATLLLCIGHIISHSCTPLPSPAPNR